MNFSYNKSRRIDCNGLEYLLYSRCLCYTLYYLYMCISHFDHFNKLKM